MSLGQEVGLRIHQNLVGVFAAVIVGAFATIGEVIAQATESSHLSANLLLYAVQTAPIWPTTGGLAVAVLAAGLFGLIGFIFELAGISIFLLVPIPGVILFSFGAVLIVVDQKVWSWGKFLHSIT